MKVKYKVLLLVFGLLLLSGLALTTSYALWTTTASQKGINALASDCFEITFEDGDDLYLYNAFPITDEEAYNQIKNDKYSLYRFKVKNICNSVMNYYINIEVLNDSSLELNYIKYGIIRDKNYEAMRSDLLSSALTVNSYVNSNVKESKRLYYSYLNANKSETFDLALWIDENAENDDVAFKTFRSKIVASASLSVDNETTVKLHANGGESASIFTFKNSNVGLDLPKATRDGYLLEGWYQDEELTQKVGEYGEIDSSVTDLYAKWVYGDNVIAAAPEVYNGMVPITLASDGTMTIADQNTKWFDYANHEWANAVLVEDSSKYLDNNGDVLESKVGAILPMEDVLQMYVWIPRYRYKLFNADFKSTSPQAIEIQFESIFDEKLSGSKNGEYLTHPAFTFGNREINGFWVGKFETSHVSGLLLDKNKLCTNSSCDTSNIRVLPNKVSIVNNSLSNFFRTTRGLETDSTFHLTSAEVDTHIVKNMEWGAIAYLTSSIYGIYQANGTCNSNQIAAGQCRIFKNPNHMGYANNTANPNGLSMQWGSSYTGCSSSSWNPALKMAEGDNEASCYEGYNWNEGGVNASTTGNTTGIYDMNGGANELVMANCSSTTGVYTFNVKSSQFSSAPESKYFDKYDVDLSLSDNDQQFLLNRGHLGDATSETVTTYGSAIGAWNGNRSYFPYYNNPWMERGGHATNGTEAGLFNVFRDHGGATYADSFRIVISMDESWQKYIDHSM